MDQMGVQNETHIETFREFVRAAGAGRIGDSPDNYISELEGRIAACVIAVPVTD